MKEDNHASNYAYTYPSCFPLFSTTADDACANRLTINQSRSDTMQRSPILSSFGFTSLQSITSNFFLSLLSPPAPFADCCCLFACSSVALFLPLHLSAGGAVSICLCRETTLVRRGAVSSEQYRQARGRRREDRRSGPTADLRPHGRQPACNLQGPPCRPAAPGHLQASRRSAAHTQTPDTGAEQSESLERTNSTRETTEVLARAAHVNGAVHVS